MIDKVDIPFLNQACRKHFGENSGVDGMDFHPTFAGWLLNCWMTIRPRTTRGETEHYVYARAIDLMRWIGAQSKRLGSEDVIQFIIAWDESVRVTGRQILKVSVKAQGCLNRSEVLTPENFVEQMAVSLYPRWDSGVVFSE